MHIAQCTWTYTRFYLFSFFHTSNSIVDLGGCAIVYYTHYTCSVRINNSAAHSIATFWKRFSFQKIKFGQTQTNWALSSWWLNCVQCRNTIHNSIYALVLRRNRFHFFCHSFHSTSTYATELGRTPAYSTFCFTFALARFFFCASQELFAINIHYDRFEIKLSGPYHKLDSKDFTSNTIESSKEHCSSPNFAPEYKWTSVSFLYVERFGWCVLSMMHD